jgi:hypothetical protein
VGAGISYFNTRQQLKHQDEKEKRELRRKKLEEIVIKLEQTSVFYSSSIAYLFSVEPPAQVDRDRFAGKTPFHAELAMLMRVYAPELEEPFLELAERTNHVSDLANQCLWQVDNGHRLDPNQALVGSLLQKEKEMHDAFKNLSLKVAELAIRYL